MVIKRVAMALTAILLLLTLAGCTGRTVVISWSPVPVVVKVGDETIEGTVTVRSSGSLSSLRIDSVLVETLDEDDEVTFTEKININRTIPIFVPIDVSERVTLKVTYDDVVNNNVRKVRITVSGSDPSVYEVEVQVMSNDPA